MNNLAFFEVVGKVLWYFGPILVDFRGSFLLFYAISRYITLFYVLLRYIHYFTLFFDSMISYLRFRGRPGKWLHEALENNMASYRYSGLETGQGWTKTALKGI